MALLELRIGDHRPSIADATLEPFPGFRVLPWMTMRVEGNTGGNFEPEIEIAFDRETNRFKPTFLGVRAEEVNGTMLRTVRVQDYLRDAARWAVYLVLDDDDRDDLPLAWLFAGGKDESIFGIWYGRDEKGPTTDRILAHVAFSYLFASLTADPPAKAVQRDIGLTPRTADNWIARARAAGLLAPASSGSDPAPQINAWRTVMEPFRGMRRDE